MTGRIVSLTLGALWLAAACGGGVATGSGSNSNWFTTCTSSADCGSGLECWCGLCTAACTKDAECSSSSGAKCKPGAGLAACTSPPPTSACFVECSSDADCRSLGDGAACSSGVCMRKQSHEDGGALTCDDRTQAIAAKVDAAVSGADASCTTDQDCTTVGLANACYESCDSVVVSKTGGAAIQSVVDDIEKNDCPAFDAAGCKVTRLPCPAPARSKCVQGTCQKDTGPGTDGGAPPACGTRDAPIVAACVLGLTPGSGPVSGTVAELGAAAQNPGCFADTNATGTLPGPIQNPSPAYWIGIDGDSAHLSIGILAPNGGVPLHLGDGVTVTFDKVTTGFSYGGSLLIEDAGGALVAFVGYGEAGPFTVQAGAVECTGDCGNDDKLVASGIPGLPATVELSTGQSLDTGTYEVTNDHYSDASGGCPDYTGSYLFSVLRK